MQPLERVEVGPQELERLGDGGHGGGGGADLDAQLVQGGEVQLGLVLLINSQGSR